MRRFQKGPWTVNLGRLGTVGVIAHQWDGFALRGPCRPFGTFHYLWLTLGWVSIRIRGEV
jgi:hypothetical protein